MKQATQPINKAWRYSAGLPDLNDNTCEGPGSKQRYAKRLVRYISDPSTVQIRVKERYGEPRVSISLIKQWREQWLKETGQLKKPDEPVEPPKPSEPVQLFPTPSASVTPLEQANEIIQKVADRFNMSFGEVIGTMRNRPFIYARNMACVLLYARYGNYANVARRMNRKDHSTIISAIEFFFKRDIHIGHVKAIWLEIAPPEIVHHKTHYDFIKAVQR